MINLRELLAKVEYPPWTDPHKIHLAFRKVDAILDALDSNGLMIVPKNPTDEMCMKLFRLWLLSDQDPVEEDFREARSYLNSAIKTSPYRKK